MAYNRIQAGRVLNASELALFEASLADRLAGLSAPQLAALIRRAQAMRDKSQDLLQRQRVATRARTGSKTGMSGAANERSAMKAQVMAQALQRFEKRAEQLEKAQERAAQKTAAAKSRLTLLMQRSAARSPATGKPRVSRKAPEKAPATRGHGPEPTSESARETRHAMQFKKAGSAAIHAHISSAGRRNQAKRDSRG